MPCISMSSSRVEMRGSGRQEKGCIVVGSSHGLGAALVDELLQTGANPVVGVARTDLGQIPKGQSWTASRRYRHVQADIGQHESVAQLKTLVAGLPSEPLLVIFNAACLEQDVRADRSIDYRVFDDVTRVGVAGFAHLLEAFEERLLTFGGTLVAISSINAFVPSVLDRTIAYPASKAYVHMAMRSLALHWPEKIKTVVIHLGHVGSTRTGGFFKLIKPPTYAATAKRIINVISHSRIPREVTYPFFYRIAYGIILRLIPDAAYQRLLRFLLKRFQSI
jgi:NAD(P)-dependent dehydrogenase (short-subunit alcohol dehydrogenase family)